MDTENDPNAIYCLKCKTRTETTNLEQVILKNGRPATTGLCAVCGKKKFQMVAWKSLKGNQPVKQWPHATRLNPNVSRKVSSWLTPAP